MLVLSRKKNESVMIDPFSSIARRLDKITALESATDVRAAVRALAVELHGTPPIVSTVVDIRGDKVRTGYTAEEDAVVFHRLEVWDAIQRERAAEAAGKDGAS